MVPIMLDDIEVRNWFQHRREGTTLLRVVIENKSQQTLRVKVRILHDDSEQVDAESGETKPAAEKNLHLPLNTLRENYLYSGDKKCIAHLQRIHPGLPLSKVKV